MNKVIYSHNLPRGGVSVPFYVGIGNAGRAYDLTRNEYHASVMNKHGKENVSVVVWETDLSMEEAKVGEIELIAFLREEGIELTNLTAGGDGSVGYRWTAAQKLKKSGSNHHMHNKSHTESFKQHLSSMMKGYWDHTPHPQLGTTHSQETKEKRAKSLAEVWTDEKRAAFSVEMRGANNPFFGKKHSPESKSKISSAKQGIKTRTDESYKLSGEKIKGLKWVTNGVVSKRILEVELPRFLSDGWCLGKTDKRSSK